MGDGNDANDVDRFMRSAEGQDYLSAVSQALEGRVIKEVIFTNETDGIAVTLHLDSGDEFQAVQQCLELGALRGGFADVLEREYYRDYPERRE